MASFHDQTTVRSIGIKALALAVLSLVSVSMVTESQGIIPQEMNLPSVAEVSREDRQTSLVKRGFASRIEDQIDTSAAVEALTDPPPSSRAPQRHNGISPHPSSVASVIQEDRVAQKASAASPHGGVSSSGGLPTREGSSVAPSLDLDEENEDRLMSPTHWERAFSRALDGTGEDRYLMYDDTIPSSPSPPPPHEDKTPRFETSGENLDEAVKSAVDAELADSPSPMDALSSLSSRGALTLETGIEGEHDPMGGGRSKTPRKSGVHRKTTTKASKKEMAVAAAEASEALKRAAADRAKLLHETSTASKVVKQELSRVRQIQREVIHNPKAVGRAKKVVSRTEAQVASVGNAMAAATADLKLQLDKVNHAVSLTKGTPWAASVAAKLDKVKKMATAVDGAAWRHPSGSLPPAIKHRVSLARKHAVATARRMINDEARMASLKKKARDAAQVDRGIKAKEEAHGGVLTHSEAATLAKSEAQERMLKKREKMAESQIRAIKAGRKARRHHDAEKRQNAAQKLANILESPKAKAKRKLRKARAATVERLDEAEVARRKARKITRKAEAAAHKLHDALVKMSHG